MAWLVCRENQRLFLSFGLVLVSLLLLNVATQANAESNVYIVYMGKSPHDDVELITSTHHEILGSILESQEGTAHSMVYSYKHGFSGFAAKMTKSQAQRAAELPGVIQVIPNIFYKLRTTRSWDYLGLSTNFSGNLLYDSKMGDNTIIGVFDTGIWPENEAFNDHGLGPVPSKWKGFCQPGDGFNPTKNCNKKLIGARYFIDGFLAEVKELNISDLPRDFISPRDSAGHGTHTASTAGGSFATNVSYNGLAFGTARGGAPGARLAIYKVGWIGGSVSSADMLKAFDEAIHDGVDVLSLSLGLEVPLYPEYDKQDIINVGSFHAVENGIAVVCAGGNAGPTAKTVSNVAPWVTTVAASAIDRSFPTPIMLGNKKTLVGQALFTGKTTGFVSLIYPDVPTITVRRKCETFTPNDTWVAGKVVLCFTIDGGDAAALNALSAVKQAGAVGIIFAKTVTSALDAYISTFPCAQVSFEIGTEIVNYFRSSKNPQVQLTPTRTHIGKPISTKVASFSSRGPNSLTPEILKPDIAAPGATILAAIPPSDLSSLKSEYGFMSGTSMATPHVAGIVALLKSLHPDWSPSAINSAMVTTAWTIDPFSGEPIYAEGEIMKLADPFDFGGGIVNPNRANDPGLVYEMGTTDFVHYLCAKGYKNSDISQITHQNRSCTGKKLSLLGLNVPSITVPNLRGSVIVTRTVTNVGGINSEYKAIVESPTGMTVAVKPEIIAFNSEVKKISFTVRMKTSYRYNTGYHFGSLTWTDGVHKVRIPISVKTEYPDPTN